MNTWINAGLGPAYADPGSPKWPQAATWPLVEATLADATISISVMGNRATVKYRDIKRVKIGMLGYVHIIGPSNAQSFGIAVLRPRRFIRELQQRGVAAERVSLRNISYYYMLQVFVLAYVLFFLFLVVRDIVTAV